MKKYLARELSTECSIFSSFEVYRLFHKRQKVRVFIFLSTTTDKNLSHFSLICTYRMIFDSISFADSSLTFISN